MKAAGTITKGILDTIRQQVQDRIANSNIDELQPGKHLRDERKAANEVQKAILKKDWQAAADAKQRQIISSILYSETKKAGDEVDAGQNMMDRLASKKAFPGISQEFTDQIHSLLERFGVKTVRDPDELQRGVDGKGLEDFAAKQYDRGYELPMTPFIASGSFMGVRKLANFRELVDMVKSLQATGREEQHIILDGQALDKLAVRAEFVNQLESLKQRDKSDYYRPEDKGIINAKKEKAITFLKTLNASLLKPEQIFDWLDGDNPDGPFNRYIFRPLKEAQHKENVMRADLVDTFRNIEKNQGKDWSARLNEDVESNLVNPETGNPFKFNRKRMISIALNWGTDDNAKKLADGYQWSEQNVKAFLDKNMTEADWNFAKQIWASFDKLRPDIDALQRRVTGVGIEFVDGRSIDTPFGKVQGGYFPLVYDATKAVAAERNAERTRDSLFENQYQRATTRNGSTISRVQNVRMPVELSMDVIPRKMGQTIHDLAFREALMSADKLLSDKHVIGAMDNSIGPEIRKLMRPWLQHVANVSNINDAAMGWGDKFLNAARTNAVMVGIGFRVTTMLKHGFTALSNSVGELGPKYMAQGIGEMFGTPQQMKRTWNMAMEMSSELRFRKDSYDRDVTENLKGFTGGTSALTRGMQQVQEYGHYGVATLDMMSAVPTWIGALRKAQDEGMNEADAVYYADKVVRKAHGAQGITDKAAIQNSQSQMWKLTTMFYGFFNHIYNRQADTVRKASMIPDKMRGGDFKGAGNDFAQVMARSVYYLVIPAIAEALWTSGGPDEDKGEGYGWWAAKAIAAEVPAGIPILRDLAKSAIEGHDYEMSPLARAANTVKGSAKDIAALVGMSDAEPSGKALQHAMESFGYFTGAPTGQAGATAQFLWDVGQGNQDPKDMAQWIQGIIHGKIKE